MSTNPVWRRFATTLLSAAVISCIAVVQAPAANAADPGCAVRSSYNDTTQSFGKLWLTCTTGFSDAKSYVLELSEKSSMNPVVSTIGPINWVPNDTQIPNLIEGRNYYWRIKAYGDKDAAGTLLYTSPVEGPVITNVYTPDVVKNLLVAPTSSTSVTASWDTPIIKASRLELRLYSTPVASSLNNPTNVIHVDGTPYCPALGTEDLPGSTTISASEIPGITNSNRLFFINGVTYRCDGPGRPVTYPNFTAAGVPFPTPTTAAKFTTTVMSFNTLGQNGADQEGAGNWDTRKPILAGEMKGADIVGTQELKFAKETGTTLRYAFDLASAAGLTVAQKGTVDNPVPCFDGPEGYGTSEPILYNADKFELATCGGDTIDVANDRHVVWTVLQDKASGQKLFVLNTHLAVGDNNAKARAESAQQIVTLLNKYRSNASIAKNLPVIVTGDFNSWEAETLTDSTEPLPATIIQQNAGLIGADFTAAKRPNIMMPSMIAWTKPSDLSQFGTRLDHILLDQNIVANSFETVIPSTVSMKTMGSDHAPIKADITVYGYAPIPPEARPCTVFTDVPMTNTFYPAICWASSTGITKGTGDGSTYSPTNPVNRGSMAAFLYRLAGSPKWDAPKTSPFVDVPTSHAFYSAITWLYAQGVTVGVTIDGKMYYQPSNAVNRGSMAAFMYRIANRPKWDPPSASPFTDVKPSNTFYPAVTWLASAKITVGSTVNGKLVYQPSNPVNRGSMAAFMNRLSKTQLMCTKYTNAVGC